LGSNAWQIGFEVFKANTHVIRLLISPYKKQKSKGQNPKSPLDVPLCQYCQLYMLFLKRRAYKIIHSNKSDTYECHQYFLHQDQRA
jgi:hypothetical protein